MMRTMVFVGILGFMGPGCSSTPVPAVTDASVDEGPVDDGTRPTIVDLGPDEGVRDRGVVTDASDDGVGDDGVVVPAAPEGSICMQTYMQASIHAASIHAAHTYS